MTLSPNWTLWCLCTTSCPIRRCVAIAQCRGSSGWCELLVYGVLAHQDGVVLVVRSG